MQSIFVYKPENNVNQNLIVPFVQNRQRQKKLSSEVKISPIHRYGTQIYYSTRVRACVAWDRNDISLRRVGDGDGFYSHLVADMAIKR